MPHYYNTSSSQQSSANVQRAFQQQAAASRRHTQWANDEDQRRRRQRHPQWRTPAPLRAVGLVVKLALVAVFLVVAIAIGGEVLERMDEQTNTGTGGTEVPAGR